MIQNEMKICLWFDHQAVEAVNFYMSIFKNSEIGHISRYGKEGFEFHKKPEGTVSAIEFSLNQMKFIALNGGPEFRFNEAISIVVNCETQEEIDHYWDGLTEGGQEIQCGWLKDKFGLSWQIVPTLLTKYLSTKDNERKSRVEKAFFRMKKFDIEELTNAYNGIQVSSLK
ncbi:MAG: VOC family protein [Methanosarcina sp.]